MFNILQNNIEITKESDSSLVIMYSRLFGLFEKIILDNIADCL